MNKHGRGPQAEATYLILISDNLLGFAILDIKQVSPGSVVVDSLFIVAPLFVEILCLVLVLRSTWCPF